MEPQEPCEQVVCGRGRCVAVDDRPTCECEPGTHAEGLTCVADDAPPANPCDPNPCVQPNRGVCTAEDAGVTCSCNPGTEPRTDGGCAVPNACEPNPCTTPNKTDCSLSEGRAVCSCVTGYVPEGDGCRPEVTVSCAGQHSAGDTFEPDECPALARLVSTTGGQEELHSLSPVADEDWLRFSATAGHVYDVSATGAAGVKLHVDVYGADGTTPLTSDHSGREVVSLTYKAGATGNLFVRVRAHERTSVGNYSIVITGLGADDYPDEPSQATTVMVPDGQQVPGALQFVGDRDVVRLRLEEGHAYRFEAAWTRSSPESLRLELLATDGAAVVASHEAEAPGFVSRVVTGGEYFLRLRATDASRRAAYTFTVTALGADDHGDTSAGSSPVSVGAPPASGGFERPGDVDVFSFQAEAGHIYVFTCNPGGGATDCFVSLSDGEGHVLATDNNGGTGSIARECTQAGPWYFRLSSSTTGSYTYQLEDLGPDDHGDDLASATPLTPSPTSNSGRLELAGDVDVFSFNGTRDTTYAFSCTSSAFTCALTLLDSNGVELLTHTASSAKVTYKVKVAGTFHVKVRGAADATGAYVYKLENLGTDDHGNTLAEATPITPSDAATAALLEVNGDVDVFRFEAQAGHIYDFTCEAGGFDCNAELVNGSGTVLASDTTSATTARVRYEVGPAGSYYFRVRQGGAAFGAYTWKLVDLGVDDFGDSQATATPVTPSNSTRSGSLELLGDQDWFSFTAEANRFYAFTCDTTAFDCNLKLRDASGTLVREDIGSSSSARVWPRSETTSTFYVNLLAASGSGGYTWKLVDLGLDDYGDWISSATPVTPSPTASSGQMTTPEDTDVFAFSATVGRIYEFTCASSTFSCNLTLQDGSGRTWATGSGTTTTPARVTFEPRSSATYYVRLTSIGGAGGYTWKLADLGLDDHGDSRETATPVTPSTTAHTGKLETSGDVDWFSFSAQFGHIYEFSCEPTGDFDCIIQLRGPTGTVLETMLPGSSPVRIRYEASVGTHYVELYSNSSPGPYTWKLMDVGTDDRPNDITKATPISTDALYSGNLETGRDMDFFSVSLTSGASYVVSTTGVTTALTVYGQDRTTVLASGPSPLSFTGRTGGTHYVKVASTGNDDSIGRYQVLVKQQW